MTQVTDTDIKELKDLITGMREEVRSELAAISTKQSDLREEMRVGFAKLEGKIDTVETKLEGKIDTANARLTNLETDTKNFMGLAEKLGELKNWKQIAFYLFTAVVSGAIGGLVGWFVRSVSK